MDVSARGEEFLRAGMDVEEPRFTLSSRAASASEIGPTWRLLIGGSSLM